MYKNVARLGGGDSWISLVFNLHKYDNVYGRFRLGLTELTTVR